MAQTAEDTSWIDGLPFDVRNTVLARMRTRRVAEGDAVYVVDDPGDACYRVQTGRIRLTNYSQSGKEIQLMELRAGDCFGETSLIDGKRRAENAYAAEQADLLVLRKSDFDPLYAAHSEIAQALNVALCRRLRWVSANAEDASLLTLSERLPRLISRLASRHGASDESGTVVISQISHSDLAHMLGVTRQSVSRELKGLERVGLITIGYRKISVPDLETFVRRFDFLVGSGPVDQRKAD
jgi:CRP-like cAMP-binding protein